MATDTDRIRQLEREVARLMAEVERYRSAAEDSLQQLDWCIGYFAGAHKGAVARSLSANRSHIRRQYLRRAEHSMPNREATQGGQSG